MNLYPFQKQGVEYLLAHPRALLADQRGLGKTPQALVALGRAGGYPALVACPTSVKTHWAHLAQDWLDGVSVELVDHRAPSGRRADITVCGYELLGAVKSRLFKTVIADEFFKCKNAAALRTQHIKAHADQADFVWGLSGSPIINRPSELISQLEILGQLQHFGGRYPFLFRYCAPVERRIRVVGKYGRPFLRKFLDTSGSARLDELNDRLRALCMLRRTKAEIGNELPVSSLQIPIYLDAVGRAEYERARRNLRGWVAERKGWDAARKYDRAAALVQLTYIRQLIAEAKVNRLIEWVEDLLEETGEKVVLFAFSRALQGALLAHWPHATRILGEDSATLRQTNIDAFVHGTNPIMVCSLKASAFGTDGLQHAARYAVFCDLGDEAETHDQAIGRLDRMGQDKEVTAYYAVAQDTLEEKMLDRLINKHEITSLVADGKVIAELLEAA